MSRGERSGSSGPAAVGARRALLIGAQTYGLTGVLPDVDLLERMLRDHGFATTCAVGSDASIDGIREHYGALIDATGPDDTALVFYAGHGGRLRLPDGSGWMQCIVPTDADRPDGAGFLLAEELSLLQGRLAERSRNTTVVLDCCHSARMSRSPDAIPRAVAWPYPAPQVVERWRALRAEQLGATGLDSHPDVVRLTACGAQESAYEGDDPEFGRHGALTAAFARLLARPDVASLTWRDAIAVIRPAIRDRFPAQRPEVEGPDDRLLFSTTRRDGVGVLPVVVRAGAVLLERADLFGVGVGDEYALVPPGADPDGARRHGVVARLVGGDAVLEAGPEGAEGLAPDTMAWPRRVSLGRRRVLVTPPAGPSSDNARAAVDRAPRLVATDRVADAFAVLRLDESVQILDTLGAALYARPPANASAAIERAVDDLGELARADHLRDLPSSFGASSIDDVAVELVRLDASGDRPVGPGETLHVVDRLVVRLSNRGASTRYVGVVDIGIGGAVTLLSTSEPGGLTLAPGDRYDLGRDWSAAGGIELEWVDGVATASGARPETLLVVVADAPVDAFARLAQAGVVTRRGDRDVSLLDRFVDDVALGRRDLSVPTGRTVEHRVHRLDLLLHPEPRGDA